MLFFRGRTQNAFVSRSRGRLFPIYVLRLFRVRGVFLHFRLHIQLTINLRSRQFTPEQETRLDPKIEVQLPYVALKINTYRHLWMQLFRKNRAIVFSLKRMR